jgi:hypothetical protein
LFSPEFFRKNAPEVFEIKFASKLFLNRSEDFYRLLFDNRHLLLDALHHRFGNKLAKFFLINLTIFVKVKSFKISLILLLIGTEDLDLIP